jgi:hemolysin III
MIIGGNIMKIKDPVSALSHLAGIIASIVGTVYLIIWAVNKGDVWDVVSFSIFGASLILLYTASTVYHWVLSEEASKILRKIDHIMIYVLIAGTYTPVCLGPLRGGWGWAIFGVVWGLTIGGLFLKLFWMNAPRWLSTAIYLAMGWVVIFAIVPMLKLFSIQAFLWLLAGGMSYTIGAIFYGLKWPDLKNKYFSFHEIFHILILLGSLCHYYFIVHFVLAI